MGDCDADTVKRGCVELILVAVVAAPAAVAVLVDCRL